MSAWNASKRPTTPIVSFFNSSSGASKTSLIYHLAWMYADLGERVLAVDLNPRATLTAMFLEDRRLEEVWAEEKPQTILAALNALLEGAECVPLPPLERIPQDHRLEDSLALIPGDPALSLLEFQLSKIRFETSDYAARADQLSSAFRRLLQGAAQAHGATLAVVDVGPTFGAMNQAALQATDYVVIPLSPDLYSVQSLSNLGPQLRGWREEAQERLRGKPEESTVAFGSGMVPLGYIVVQDPIRLDRPDHAYEKWIRRIPEVYRKEVLGQTGSDVPPVTEDLHCLAVLKHYWTLMPMALEARKPMFHLKPADGALGAHLSVAREAGDEFERLAKEIRSRISDDASPARATA